MIKKENLQDLYPLSPMQESILYHALLKPDSPAYHEQVIYHISGPIDVMVMKKSWQILFERHDVLRTVFVFEKVKRPLQAVLRQTNIEFDYHDMRQFSEDEQQSALKKFNQTDYANSFDLNNGPLMRMSVSQLNNETFVILWSLHHIIMDGWCVGLLLHEFTHIYIALQNNESDSLPAPPAYSRYIQWVEQQNQETAKNYWKKALAGYHQSVDLPGKRPPTDVEPETSNIKRLNYRLPTLLTTQLKQYSVAWQVTLGSIMQAAWAALLAKYNDCNDVVFGMTVSGRPANLAGVEGMMGVFINTIPLRLMISETATLQSLAEKVQARAIASEPYHYLPLSDIQQCNKLGNDLINHVLAFENYPTGQSRQIFDVTHIEKTETPPYDFNIIIEPGEHIDILLMFAPDQFHQSFVERIVGHLQALLSAGLTEHNPALRHIDILDEKEKHKLLQQFNNTSVALPKQVTWIDYFEQHATTHPDQIAVFDDSLSLTYQTLDQRANYLAHYLKTQYAIQAEQRVAVIIHRSHWLVQAFLGINKASAVYVPIDPDHPLDRQLDIIADAQCQLVLTDDPDNKRLQSKLAIPLISICQMEQSQIVPPARDLTADPLSYIIYTSGSTGKPKGIMIEHHGVLNLALSYGDFATLNSHCRLTLFSSPAFDASIFEMAPALTNGAALVIVPDEMRYDCQQYCQFIYDMQVTHSYMPPALCEQACQFHAELIKNTLILSGGDILKNIGTGSVQVSNNYGPSEYSVAATCCMISTENAQAPFPIGKPINNTEIFIINSQQQLCPIQVTGEICIAGEGLARGYWQQPEMTQQKFVAHPFKPNTRMYRSGDRGRWREDGQLEFLGRLDDQLKIHGHRIEPTEIESALLAHPDIQEAAVISKQTHNNPMLIAFIVAHGDHLNKQALLNWLAKRIPKYMMPSQIHPCDTLARTHNGKLDRRALQQQADQLLIPSDTSPPSTTTECVIANIWQQVLSIESIKRYDNFFSLGGHSLTAMRVLSQLRNHFKKEIPLQLLFDQPILAELANAVEQVASNATENNTIRRVSRENYRSPVTPKVTETNVE